MPSARLAVLALILAACAGEPEPFARAFEIERLDQAIGGPKALARPGDLMLENDQLRVAILGARSSMGPGLHGGSIIDADLQWNDPRFANGKGLDQFSELFPTVSMNVMLPEDVTILADGSDGGAAVVRVESEAVPFLEMLEPLWIFVNQPDMYLVTDYTLAPGEPWVTIDTTVYFGWDGEGEPPEAEPAGHPGETMPVIEWAVETGAVLGDFYLSGGHVDVFGPGMGFDEDGEVYAARQRGANLFLEPFRFDFLAGVGDGVSYGIAPADGAGFVPLFTASQTAIMGAGREGNGSPGRFPAGTALSYRRWFFVGDGDVGSIVDAWLAASGQPFGYVRGHVIEESTDQPLTDAHVFVYEPGAERPWSEWRTDSDARDDVDDGSFEGRLPVGDWELMVHAPGRPDSKRVPVTVELGGEHEVAIQSPRPGILSFSIRDEWGRLVPGKVSIFPAEGRVPVRDPILGDGYIAGSPEAVTWPMYGQGEIALPEGRYVAVASRGIEYEIDVSEPFDFDPTARHHLDFQVIRSIDTSGWVSADLHVHAAPSHDSGVSRVDRVRTMVAEGVEFMAATDHDYLTDYGPTIEDLGLEEWLRAAVGNETTTVEIGHFLGFPMAEDFLGDAGGAFDWTGMTPEEILDTLREAGREAGYEPVVFVGHPRAGILGYFDQYGFDPYAGVPGGAPVLDTPTLSIFNDLLSPANFTLEFDAMEVLATKDHYFFRTPTQPELDRFAEDGSTAMYELLTRTMAEQEDLSAGVYRFGFGHEGQVEDWFALLNLGHRHTALANSDTHDWTGTEAGCPRNFIVSSTDQPALIDPQEMADAVREHRVVATYGPFVRLWVDGAEIGSELVPTDATVELTVEVQAPTWIDVDRVEIYQNGTLIAEREVTGDDPFRFQDTLEVTLDRDSWFVAIAAGDGDMAPVFTPVEIPYIPLDEVVVEALSGVDAIRSQLPVTVPIPREYPVHPFGLTNPIWVDLDGDGFDAPGLPTWLRRPLEP